MYIIHFVVVLQSNRPWTASDKKKKKGEKKKVVGTTVRDHAGILGAAVLLFFSALRLSHTLSFNLIQPHGTIWTLVGRAWKKNGRWHMEGSVEKACTPRERRKHEGLSMPVFETNGRSNIAYNIPRKDFDLEVGFDPPTNAL